MSIRVGLHPASIPTLALISLVATFNVPSNQLDSLLHLALTAIYEQAYPPTFHQWLARLHKLAPPPQSSKTAADIEETVSPTNRLLSQPRRESSSQAHTRLQVLALVRGGLDSLNGWLNGAPSPISYTLVPARSFSCPPPHLRSPDLKPLCPSSEEEEVSFSRESAILATMLTPRCPSPEQRLVDAPAPNLPSRSLPPPLSHDLRQALLRRSRRLVGRRYTVVSGDVGRAGSEDSEENCRRCVSPRIELDRDDSLTLLRCSYTRAKGAQDYQATKDSLSFYDLDDATSR